MLKLRERQLRKINTSHKVYVPQNARDNQYIILEFSPSDELFEKAKDHQLPASGFEGFYRFISNEFFKLSTRYGLNNVSLIASNKLIKIRFSEETQTIETEEQILFLYNPNSNHSLNSFYHSNQFPNKIQLLFLAGGNFIRNNASTFHLNVLSIIGDLSSLMQISISEIKIKDHQHLTFNLLSNNKNTKTHGFRELVNRYSQESVSVPNNSNSLSYSIATLPINKYLLDNIEIDISSEEPYKGLYQYISNLIFNKSKENNLSKVIMVANNKLPIIRHSENEFTIIENELIHLGVNFKSTDSCFSQFVDGKYLANNIHFIFIPIDFDTYNKSYGKYINRVVKTVRTTSKILGFQDDKDTINFRFYQHLSYYQRQN